MGEEKVEDIKGRVKEAAGDLTEDEKLQREGKLDQASANVKEKVGDVAETVKEGVEKAKDKAGDAMDKDKD
jgi:uncharacterized protein YjbJ (UPF0337 family)